MTQTPQHFSPLWAGGTRPKPSPAAGERETLTGLLRERTDGATGY